MVPDPTGRSLMTNPGRTRHVRAVTCTVAPPSTDNQGLVVLGEEILVQTFELDCPAGADPKGLPDLPRPGGCAWRWSSVTRRLGPPLRPPLLHDHQDV